MTPRPALAAELAPLARFWHRRWHDAHDDCWPAELLPLRSPESFAVRIAGFGDGLRVIGAEGAVQGFCAVVGNHVDQIYIDADLQGSGAALILLRDAEARIAAAGHAEALLECNPGNKRAAAFYHKAGWSLRGLETVQLNGPQGEFPYECLVFSRRLRG